MKNRKYYMKVKTKKYLIGYDHLTFTNIDNGMESKMQDMIIEYNENILNKNPNKMSLVTKVQIELDFTLS